MFRQVPAVVLTPEEDRRRLRRQRRVMGGLFLTLAGVFFSAGLLPSGTSDLEHTLPLLGLALVLVWIGGLLLGGSAGRRPKDA